MPDTLLETNEGLLRKRIPFFYILIAIVLIIAGIIWREILNEKKLEESRLAVPVQKDCPPPPVVQYRMNEYKYTHPLLLGDSRKESEKLTGLKNDIDQFIKSKIESGQISDASVYVRRLNDGNWMSVNDGDSYQPGSLIKVPVMMTYLRESEITPGLLDRKIFYAGPEKGIPLQTFNSQSMQPQHEYTIRQLLYYMVALSDNNATLLLNRQVNQAMLINLFTDVGLPEPDLHSKDYGITASGYSKFLRMLYNASYISSEDADFALSLMTESTFTQGLVEGLPHGIKIAHKFGEMGEVIGMLDHQLHESGVVYMDDQPYVITVMTKGRDVKPLPEIISEISRRVYNCMSNFKKNS